MNDITCWIDSYRNSCRLVQGRIVQINREIASLRDGQQQRELASRRYKLYEELWDMQKAMKNLQDYERARSRPQ